MAEVFAILDRVWQDLERGAKDAHHPFHTMTLATLTAKGPEARVVVLRRVDAGERTIRFHTDVRAPKVAEIRADGRVSVVFYDAPGKVQIRLSGMATVHTQDAVAEQAWEASRLSSRRCYLVEEAPGTPVERPGEEIPEHLRKRIPTLEESLPGYANFSVVEIEVTRIEWLWLYSEGHHRARFEWEGAWQGMWVQA